MQRDHLKQQLHRMKKTAYLLKRGRDQAAMHEEPKVSSSGLSVGDDEATSMHTDVVRRLHITHHASSHSCTEARLGYGV